jgi:hypothetical protein
MTEKRELESINNSICASYKLYGCYGEIRKDSVYLDYRRIILELSPVEFYGKTFPCLVEISIMIDTHSSKLIITNLLSSDNDYIEIENFETTKIHYNYGELEDYIFSICVKSEKYIDTRRKFLNEYTPLCDELIELVGEFSR